MKRKQSESTEGREAAISGVKATALNGGTVLASSLCFALLIVSIILVSAQFKVLNKTTEKFAVCQSSTALLKENSDYMTEQARLFVVTGRIQYLTNYFHEKDVNQGRNHALEALQKVFDEDDIEYKRIETAFMQSESLVALEIYAMKLKYEGGTYPGEVAPGAIVGTDFRDSDRGLTKEEMSRKAVEVLFDGGYMIYKLRIDQNCTQLVNDITVSIRNDLSEATAEFRSRLLLMIILQIVSFLAVLAFITANSALVISPIRSFLHSISVDGRFQEKGAFELRLLAHTYNGILQLKEARERRLKKNAEIDPLTGALNRRAFDAVCSDFVLSGTRTVLLMLDVDNFKGVNDTYGHSGGDKALQTLARELKEGFRASDFVARLGGDEFAVLLPDFKGIVEDILAAKIGMINEHLGHIEGLGPVSISVGAAVSEDGFSNDMFDKADKALYETKRKGKRGVSVYTGE